MSEYHDDLMGFAEWTKNKHVLVFRRTYGNRVYIRRRVFNKHREHGFFYPSPRSFHVGQECAFELGQIISRAAQGRASQPPPDWWPGFQEQYERKGKLAPGKWKREPQRSQDGSGRV